MNSIIALFWYDVDSARSIQRLKEVGFVDDRISTLINESAIWKLLDPEPVGVVTRYATWGAAIEIAIYGIFGALVGWCQCNLLSFGRPYGIVAFLGAILAGAFVGGFLGCFMGVAQREADNHLYIQGTRLGGRVVIVQASEQDVERANLILEQENASGGKVLQ